jgi:glutamine cyclotransferase
MNGLLTADESRGVDALNGIAWDEKQNRLFVTGKLWPKIFEIEVIEK